LRQWPLVDPQIEAEVRKILISAQNVEEQENGRS
tara:strand:+ start:1288 stop:1389 length:102 start_codon:yes stop_codon:yes gene_type:complete